jgi:hypothetical protein
MDDGRRTMDGGRRMVDGGRWIRRRRSALFGLSPAEMDRMSLPKNARKDAKAPEKSSCQFLHFVILFSALNDRV